MKYKIYRQNIKLCLKFLLDKILLTSELVLLLLHKNHSFCNIQNLATVCIINTNKHTHDRFLVNH